MDDRIRQELDGFQNYLLERGHSANIGKNYRFRASTFFKARPEVLGANEDVARAIVEEYIATLPCNTARTIPAGAVRCWWSYRFGKPYRGERISVADVESGEAIETELTEFREYLEKRHNLAEGTIATRISSIRNYLVYTFRSHPFDRVGVDLPSVIDYFTAKAAGTSTRTGQTRSCDIHSYARFLRSVGIDVSDIEHVSFAAPRRRDHIVLGRLSEESYSRFLSSFNTDTERGRRDLAMAMLMGNLGLRACDVAHLAVDDVDWRASTVTVSESKSKTARTLPLDEVTGTAIANYLESRGPSEMTRAMFLNTAGSPIKSHDVQTAMSLAAGRAGIEEYHGTHGLRRMVATNMANAGVNVKTIADVLGHERIDTTVGYVKVAETNLAKVAWPAWPGGGASR